MWKPVLACVPALLLALAACGSEAPAGPPPDPAAAAAADAPLGLDPEIAAFYRENLRHRIWTEGGRAKPEAAQLARILASAASHGLDPERYGAPDIAAALAAARTGDAHALARAELLLSRGYTAFVRDLRIPLAAAAPIYAEPDLAPAPPPSPRALLEAAAAAPSLRDHVAASEWLNPLYDGLKRGFSEHRGRWSSLPHVTIPAGPALAPGAEGERVALLRRRLGLGPGDRYDERLAANVRAFKAAHGLPADPVADEATLAALNAGPAHYDRLIRANLERARAIPADPGRRFVLVDAAAARLWLFEDGQVRDSMRAIVGKPGMQTPMLAARIRYAVLNPYWNVPVDLARERAKRVLREGASVLARERLQILSQFSAADRVLSPASVNWRRVAAGREPLRLRQLPGGANVMGAVKFMMPNNLDIYLHDFPDKSLFAQSDRRISSGCVRLEDAPRLARWLFGGTAPRPDGPRPEQRVDLPEPVPVYITYLTVIPAAEGVAFRPDPYGRDPALLAALNGAGRSRRAG